MSPVHAVLGPGEGSQLRQEYRELGEGSVLVVISVSDSEQAQAVVQAATAVLNKPTTEEEIQAALWHEFGMLTCADVAGQADVGVSEPLSWARAGKVLKSYAGEVELFFGFQFDDWGQPYPVIASVKAAKDGYDDMDIARWFVSKNAHLGGARPVDLMAADPALIASCARAGN